MSRTNKSNEGMTNPAELFLRWDSENSNWSYWNKEKEVRESIPVGTPFIVLDQLNTVAGYHNTHGGIWSNEVRKGTDTLRVMAGKGNLLAEGPWLKVKEKTGAKFAISVYAMANIGGEYKLVNFKLSGCAVGPWIDFVKEIGGRKTLEDDVVVYVKEVVQGKKGKVVYNSPVFAIKTRKLSEEAAKQADEMDTLLQDYLTEYLGREPHKEEHKAGQSHEEEPSEPEHEEAPLSDEEDGDVPF